MSNNSYWSNLYGQPSLPEEDACPGRRRRGGALSSSRPAAEATTEKPSQPQNKDRSGLLLQPTDSSSQAKGAGLTEPAWTTHISWDQSFNTFGLHFTAAYVYSRLMKYKVGTVDKLPDGTLEPDFA